MLTVNCVSGNSREQLRNFLTLSLKRLQFFFHQGFQEVCWALLSKCSVY